MINRDLIMANSESYPARFGIDLRNDPFQWFFLSVLFGARISQRIAARTFFLFRSEGITTPESILDAGFDRIVSILDAGGYARYDFRTAVKLADMSKAVIAAGGLEAIHRTSTPEELPGKLKGLSRGIGDVTVGIFMREMIGVWENARAIPSPLALDGAEFAGLSPGQYTEYGVSYARFESFLVKIGRECVRSRKVKNRGFCDLIKSGDQ